MGYSLVDVDEIEGCGPGGAVRFVRRELGVEASGSTGSSCRRRRGLEHDETATRQEEVN